MTQKFTAELEKSERFVQVKEGGVRVMKKVSMKTAILLLIVGMLFSGIIGFFIGRDNLNVANESVLEITTFYATVLDVNGDFFHVKGLDVNDINFRGEFTFVVDKDTIIEWRYEAMNVSELKVGQQISISFIGPIMESHPAQLSKIVKIQLLDDKK